MLFICVNYGNIRKNGFMMDSNKLPIDEIVLEDSQLLSQQLQALSERLFPPEANKKLRKFSSAETARLIGITDSYIRQLAKQDNH